MKKELMRQAIHLRKQGYLYAEIAQELGIARSTASLWLKSLEFDAATTQKITERQQAVQAQKIRSMAAATQAKTKSRERIINAEAQSIVANLELTTNAKILLCATLWWCEGEKNVSGGVKFINSDPDMVRVFLGLMRECFAINDAKLRALIHLHEYHDGVKQLALWSDVTGIPPAQFYKPYLKPHTGKNQRENYPGCISVRYPDVSLGKLLKMVYSEFGKSYRGIVHRLV